MTDLSGQAFPVESRLDRGLTKREYFAAHAPIDYDLVVRIFGSQIGHSDSDRAAWIAVWTSLCFEYADAMIAEADRENASAP